MGRTDQRKQNGIIPEIRSEKRGNAGLWRSCSRSLRDFMNSAILARLEEIDCHLLVLFCVADYLLVPLFLIPKVLSNDHTCRLYLLLHCRLSSCLGVAASYPFILNVIACATSGLFSGVVGYAWVARSTSLLFSEAGPAWPLMMWHAIPSYRSSMQC